MDPSDDYDHDLPFFQQPQFIDGTLVSGDSILQPGQEYDPNGMKRESPMCWSTMPQMHGEGLKQMKVEEGTFLSIPSVSPEMNMNMFNPSPPSFSPQQNATCDIDSLASSGIQQPEAVRQTVPSMSSQPGVQLNQLSSSPQPQLLNLPDAKQRDEASSQYMTSGLRSARRILDQVEADLKSFKDLLPQIRIQQFEAIHSKNSDRLQALLAQESEMVGRFKAMNDRIEELDHGHILVPDELRMISELRQESYIACEQLNLYFLEAQQIISSGSRPSSCIASLVITSQPFPLVLSKGKLVDSSLDVAILTGATQELKQTQHFMPIIATNPPTKSVAQNIVTVAKEEAASGNTTRLKLKMMNGSRMMPVMVKMSIAVAYPSGSIMLESQCSNPFIVITNENQYEESNGSLLKYLAFGVKNDTPWTHFANELQRHFVQATKQDGSTPQVLPVATPISAAAAAAALTPENLPIRPLSVHDLEYIHNRFFAGRPVIAVSQFDQFWAWFGKILQRMRSTRQICGMWRDGLLWGFANRNEVEQALMPQPPGSFVVRFSERHAGHFAIAYKNPMIEIRGQQSEPPTPQIVGQVATGGSCIKHYLVKPEEISTQKTLPDFLNDIGGLSVMIRVLYNDFGTEIDPPFRLVDPLYIPISKTEALEKFLSKREQVDLIGYDPDLSPMPMMM